MIKHIDLFIPPIGEFGVIKHFTRQFHTALQRAGIKTRLLVAEKDNPKPFLDKIFQDPPDCTMSFNGLLPDENGNFLCELIQIPHVACLVDSSPIYYIPLTQSLQNVITCPDRYFCSFFQNLNFNNVFFLPQAIEKDINPTNFEKDEVVYDVTFLGNCYDYEAIKEGWQTKYPPPIYEALILAVEISRATLDITFMDALVQALNEKVVPMGLPMESLNFIEILDELETYMRGLDRVDLVKSIKNAEVHIFCSNEGKKIWSKLLGKSQKNVHYHQAVPFEDALEVMRKSKILLNSSPSFKCGAHERVFAGLACGSLVMTSESLYLSEEGFKDGQNILFYKASQAKEINDKIDLYLSNEAMRVAAIAQGRDRVMSHHTWDSRVPILLNNLEPMLLAVKQAQGI